MVKKLLFFVCLLCFTSALQAQYLHEEPQVDFHQIYLDEPAHSLDQIIYEKEERPADGQLSPDGMRVLIKNYKEKTRIKVNVTYKSGRQEEFSRSSCFIDPVPPL